VLHGNKDIDTLEPCTARRAEFTSVPYEAMDATGKLQENTGMKGGLKGAVMGGIGGVFYLGFDRTRAGNSTFALLIFFLFVF
jgi:hypothetical protein